MEYVQLYGLQRIPSYFHIHHCLSRSSWLYEWGGICEIPFLKRLGVKEKIKDEKGKILEKFLSF